MVYDGPTRVLFTLAAAGDWDSVASRCTTHPQDARFRDAWTGYNALHVALERDPPEWAVEKLIRAHPDGARIGSSVGRDDDVYLPLHTAAAAGASPEALRLVGSAYPDAANRGGGHHFPGLAPLWNLWGHYFGMPIWRSGTIAWEGHGWWYRPQSNRRLYGHLATISAARALASLPMKEFWVQASLLLDIASRGRRATDAPILESGDELLVIRAASALGLFAGPGGRSSEPPQCPGELRGMIARVLQSILQGVSRGELSRGRYLLHRAIEDGLPLAVILELYQAYTGALSLRDNKTKLFPFMLASASSFERHSPWQMECFNMTFELLKKNPTLVMM